MTTQARATAMLEIWRLDPSVTRYCDACPRQARYRICAGGTDASVCHQHALRALEYTYQNVQRASYSAGG